MTGFAEMLKAASEAGEASRAVEMLKPLSSLTKAECLLVLERVPQRYWPPRPTRQETVTLRRAILQSLHGAQQAQVVTAIESVLKARLAT